MPLRIVLISCVFSLPCWSQFAVGHWRLDETSGTVASDSSPGGNTGALVAFGATPWVPAIHGNGLQCDGVDDYVNCTLNAGLPIFDGLGSPYSFAAWVKGVPQDDDRIYSEGSSLNNNTLFTIGSGRTSNGTADRLQLYIRNDTGVIVLNRQSISPVFDSTWHHVAVTDTGGGAITVYIDGVPDAASFAHGFSGTWTANLVSLGAVLRATPCCFFTGCLDDVRVYPFALGLVDVAAVMNDVPLVLGYQVNREVATLSLNGVEGSAFNPAVANVALSTPFSLVLSTTLGGFPWDMAIDAGGITIPNGIVVPQNIINVNIAGPGSLFVNGGFATTFGNPVVLPGFGGPMATSTATLTFVAPSSSLNAAMQFVVIDPSSPIGLSVSGAADLSVQ